MLIVNCENASTEQEEILHLSCKLLSKYCNSCLDSISEASYQSIHNANHQEVIIICCCTFSMINFLLLTD